MLMAVPVVSDRKALAIFQHYPSSLTKLMVAADEDQIDEENKIKMIRVIKPVTSAKRFRVDFMRFFKVKKKSSLVSYFMLTS